MNNRARTVTWIVVISFWLAVRAWWNNEGFDSQPAGGFAGGVVLILIMLASYVAGLFAFAGINSRKTEKLVRHARRVEEGFEHVNYGIPYCEFTRTADGFNASFFADTPKNSTLEITSVLGFIIVTALCVAIFTARANFFTAMLSAAICGGVIELFAWIYKPSPTVISLTKDAVIIDGRKLRRADFHGFHTTKHGSRERLSYTYGDIPFELDGYLTSLQAPAIAAGLNQELRSGFNAPDEKPVSVTQLRGSRPTEF